MNQLYLLESFQQALKDIDTLPSDCNMISNTEIETMSLGEISDILGSMTWDDKVVMTSDFIIDKQENKNTDIDVEEENIEGLSDFDISNIDAIGDDIKIITNGNVHLCLSQDMLNQWNLDMDSENTKETQI